MYKEQFDGDKEKFDTDWELVKQIDGMAIDYFHKGFSPIETQFMILNSDLFLKSLQLSGKWSATFTYELASYILGIYVNNGWKK